MNLLEDILSNLNSLVLLLCNTVIQKRVHKFQSELHIKVIR